MKLKADELKRRFNFKEGDIIKYLYIDDLLPGRIIKLLKEENKAIIEVGICGKRYEDIFKDNSTVSMNLIYPFDVTEEDFKISK